MAVLVIIWYGTFMEQVSSISKMAGRAGSLMAIVGLLVFFAGVFSFAPRIAVIAGIAMFVLAIVAFIVEEYGQRK